MTIELTQTIANIRRELTERKPKPEPKVENLQTDQPVDGAAESVGHRVSAGRRPLFGS